MRKNKTRSRRERVKNQKKTFSRHSPGRRDPGGKKLRILTIVQVVIAFIMVGLIVIQWGKGANGGAAFGSERRMPGIDGRRPIIGTDDRLDSYVAKTEYEKLRREVGTLKSQMQRLLKALSAAPASKPAAAEPPASKPAVAETTSEKNPVPSAPPSPRDRVAPADREEFAAEKGDRGKEAAEAKRELDQFLRAQKVLFKPGEVQLEFGASYAQDTETNRVNPLGPVYSIRSASANFLMRYGLAEDLEFDLGVPLVYTQLERDIRPFRTIEVGPIIFQSFTREANVGLGDIDWGLRYAALHEGEKFDFLGYTFRALPEVTLNVNAKSDTGDVERLLGTGHWNVGTGVSLVKTIDPVVLFGSLGYTWTLEAEDVDPGDQIPYAIGMGFSLNDRVSFSMMMGGAAIRRTEVNGGAISGSGLDVNSLQFTTTVQLAKRVYLEPVVGFGMTDDAADFMVGINVPFGLEGRFPLPFFHNL